MQNRIIEIGLPMFITALGGSFAGGWLSMFCFVMSGFANRAIGNSERRKEAFKVTVRQASKWAIIVGIGVGLIIGYIFVRRTPDETIHAGHYFWVGLGSMGIGFVTASGFFGYFGGSGESV